MEHILYANTEPIGIISDETKEETKYVHYLEVSRTVFEALFRKKTNCFVTFDSTFVRPPIPEPEVRYRVEIGDFMNLSICYEQKNGSTELEDLSIIGKIDFVEDFCINKEHGLKIVLNKETLKHIKSII